MLWSIKRKQVTTCTLLINTAGHIVMCKKLSIPWLITCTLHIVSVVQFFPVCKPIIIVCTFFFVLFSSFFILIPIYVTYFASRLAQNFGVFIALQHKVLKVCRTPGPTACSRTKMLQLAKLSVFEKLVERRKNSMTRPWNTISQVT